MRSYRSLLLTTLAVATAAAQEPPPQPVAPVPVRVPMSSSLFLHAETWDGRVFIRRGDHPLGSGRQGWVVQVLRPEALVRGASGAVEFPPESVSPPVPLELDYPFHTPGANQVLHADLALVPAPGLDLNPFPSDALGNPVAGGGHACYELVIYARGFRVGSDFGPQVEHLGLRRARVVLAAPGTPAAAVALARVEPFQALRTAQGDLVRGAGITATFDGRLLVFEGETPGADLPGEHNTLLYSWNHTPGAAAGWSAPRNLVDMHLDRDTPVAGIPFAERYPLAAAPLLRADGRPFRTGEPYPAAYAWITHDGSELVHTSLLRGGTQARHAGLTVIGRFTGNAMKLIDGPLNPDRHTTTRTQASSPGTAPGFWRPYRMDDGRARPGMPIPYSAERPVMSLFLLDEPASYGEVSLAEHADGDYTVYLPMNELFGDATPAAQNGLAFSLDTTRTPDTSGRFRTATLAGGAAFPLECAADGQDRNVGRVGQAIYFPPAGVLRAPALEVAPSVTGQLFLNRLRADTAARLLLALPGAWALQLLPDGALRIDLRAAGAWRTLRSPPASVLTGRWTHVAFSHDAARGRLRLHVDGREVGAFDGPPGAVQAATAELLVGPGAITPGPGAGTEPILVLDEVAVSRVVRSEDELRRAAFQPLTVPPFQTMDPTTLPLGLSAADARVPLGERWPPDPRAVELGRLLFFDPRLSGDGTISCATCHDPRQGFADGLARARGVGGRALARHTPSVVNRALSTAQLWDGRGASLEEQALLPIEHPEEMNADLDQVLAALQAVAGYRLRFYGAFGELPSRTTLARALTSYERSLLSGDSDVDRLQAGQALVLPPDTLGALERGQRLFRGKARCVGCHAGSSYTDEAFHATAPSLDRSDVGRLAITGRAVDRLAFKTPTLRDLPRSAPYFHDGSAASLADVVEVYDRGGLHRDARSPELRPLGLTAGEKADLVAFLTALTGRTVDTRAPTTLPR